MGYKGIDHVFRTKGLHPRYRVFGGEQGQPLCWDSRFKDYLSECEELEEEIITHHTRRLTTQDFQGKESSFVGMDSKEKSHIIDSQELRLSRLEHGGFTLSPPFH